MNFTQSILNRELISYESKLNILLIDNEHNNFKEYIENLGHRLIVFNDLYLGGEVPNLILCNNKVVHYNTCRSLSVRYHVPSIIVDHNVMSDLLDNAKSKFLDNLPCSYKIAINLSIYKSWGSIHDKVLNYLPDQECKQTWSKLLIDTSKRIFTI